MGYAGLAVPGMTTSRVKILVLICGLTNRSVVRPFSFYTNDDIKEMGLCG